MKEEEAKNRFLANMNHEIRIPITDSEISKPLFDGEVLICEDNHMNQKMVCNHLVRVGLKVCVADNGKIGLDMVKERIDKGQKPYSLIFMDIHMPVMDGIEAADKINKLNIGVPIVALTANVMSHDRELYLKYGIKDYLGKPFVSKELKCCLLKYLKPVKWQTVDKASSRKYDKKLRYTLIKNFIKDNQDIYARITNALNAEDIKLANRLAHTLKGNAGILDKTVLQKAAAEVEGLLKDGKNLVTEEHLKRLETELQAVLKELEPLVKEAELPQTPIESLGREKERKLLEEIKPFLESGNSVCLKYVDALRGIAGSGRLIEQIEDLDFEQALETLGELVEDSEE